MALSGPVPQDRVVAQAGSVLGTLVGGEVVGGMGA